MGADELHPGWINWPSNRPTEGACWNCGFLSRHDVVNTQLSIYPELTDFDREWSRFYTMSGWNMVPWCFEGEEVLADISAASGLGHPPRSNGTDEDRNASNNAAMRVLSEDRQCGMWFRHKPGRSPVQHWEARNLERLEELRRQNDLKIAEFDLRSQESSRAIAEATQKANEALLTITREAHGSAKKYTWAFIVLAAISCLQVLSLAWPDGIPVVMRLVENEPAAVGTPVATATPVPSTSMPQPTRAP